jgi:ubiquinone/menaquinone biosynthesis C-methylase UbiE
MNSISFDRAADIYDSTRGHPPEISKKIAASLAVHLFHNNRVLEVGIGTGRIARPLLKHGFAITGVDISRKMMERLGKQLDPVYPSADLAEANAVWLPFSNRVFDAAIFVHVIHLVSEWKQLLFEVHRVITKPGKIIIGYDWYPEDTPSGMLRTKWDEIVSGVSNHARHDFKKRFQDVKQTITGMGASFQEWTAVEWSIKSNLRNDIEKIEARTWSSTWQVDDDQFQDALHQIKEWAGAAFGEIDYEYTYSRKFIWQAFSWES